MRRHLAASDGDAPPRGDAATGINRLETGPLMRCTFEETVEILFEAAAYSMPDRCLGSLAPSSLLNPLTCMPSWDSEAWRDVMM